MTTLWWVVLALVVYALFVVIAVIVLTGGHTLYRRSIRAQEEQELRRLWEAAPSRGRR